MRGVGVVTVISFACRVSQPTAPQAWCPVCGPGRPRRAPACY